MTTNRQIKLVSYAEGLPDQRNFELAEAPLPELRDGELLARLIYLGMDPFPRLRMSGNSAVAPQVPLGSTMIGRGVARVVESRHPGFAAGDYVAGELGWQDYAVGDGNGLRKVDPSLAPVASSLGVLGPSGLAAYFATLRQGKPQPGQTVIVSAASGSVGSAAGQIAKIHGARVVGIAGGAAQIGYLHELGFDAAVDYKAEADLAQAIGAACPQGVDVFVDTVGGEIHDAVMPHINVGARIVLVGTIANYNLGPGEVDSGPRHLYQWILKRAVISGFLVADYAGEWPAALAELAGWLREGRLRYRETVFEGLESAPRAFAALFGSDSVGKMLVRVGDESSSPTAAQS